MYRNKKQTDKTINTSNGSLINTLSNSNKFAILIGEKPPKEEIVKKPVNKKFNTNVPIKQSQNKQTNTTKEKSLNDDKDCNKDTQNHNYTSNKQNIDTQSNVNTETNIQTNEKNNFVNQKTMYVETFADQSIQSEEKILDDGLGNNLFLQSPWTVWIHKSDCQVWTEESYTNIYVINSIGSFWRFFNNFHALDKLYNQLFIMRNKIKPIWEDNDNRNGGICSIKFDCYSKQGRIDIGVETMLCISLLVMNETMLQSNEEINGISYSIKNKSVLIKLWCRNYNNKIADKLPRGLFSKLETILKNNDRGQFKKQYNETDTKLSIRYTQIKPEHND